MPMITQGQFQEIDGDGNPYASGKLYTYEAGTSNALSTYPTKDDAIAETNANDNPTVMDSRGAADIWLKAATGYKFVFKSSADATIYTVDDITKTEDISTMESKTPSELQVAVYEDVSGSYKLTNAQTENTKDFKIV